MNRDNSIKKEDKMTTDERIDFYHKEIGKLEEKIQIDHRQKNIYLGKLQRLNELKKEEKPTLQFYFHCIKD